MTHDSTDEMIPMEIDFPKAQLRVEKRSWVETEIEVSPTFSITHVLVKTCATRDIAPGEDADEHRVYRCAQCLRIVPYENGGSAATELALAPDELDHLERCCDDCWASIIAPLEEAARRLLSDGSTART